VTIINTYRLQDTWQCHTCVDSVTPVSCDNRWSARNMSCPSAHFPSVHGLLNVRKLTTYILQSLFWPILNHNPKSILPLASFNGGECQRSRGTSRRKCPDRTCVAWQPIIDFSYSKPLSTCWLLGNSQQLWFQQPVSQSASQWVSLSTRRFITCVRERCSSPGNRSAFTHSTPVHRLTTRIF